MECTVDIKNVGNRIVSNVYKNINAVIIKTTL